LKNIVKRRLCGLVGSLVLAGGALVGTAGAAQAASPCPGTHLDNWSIQGGYMSVYYDAATGRNCALTYTNTPGVTQSIDIEISLWSSSTVHRDAGQYKYYAGPVFVSAPHQCIRLTGRVGGGAYATVDHPLYCS
jgi:hypothetical protein